jgi:hypothetical protein
MPRIDLFPLRLARFVIEHFVLSIRPTGPRDSIRPTGPRDRLLRRCRRKQEMDESLQQCLPLSPDEKALIRRERR